MTGTQARPTKRCNRCGGEWDLEACYRRNSKPHGQVPLPKDYRAMCVMCELTERNDPTPEERARRKAYNSIDSHAGKLNIKPGEFAKRYGWDIERMAYDILHGHENTCPYCYEKYSAMGHGLSDITLDIVDPQREPYYRTNTRWCCITCNLEKSKMPPHLWDIRCAAWKEWAAHRDAVKADPTHGLPLFAPPRLI